MDTWEYHKINVSSSSSETHLRRSAQSCRSPHPRPRASAPPTNLPLHSFTPATTRSDAKLPPLPTCPSFYVPLNLLAHTCCDNRLLQQQCYPYSSTRWAVSATAPWPPAANVGFVRCCKVAFLSTRIVALRPAGCSSTFRLPCSHLLLPAIVNYI